MRKTLQQSWTPLPLLHKSCLPPTLSNPPELRPLSLKPTLLQLQRGKPVTPSILAQQLRTTPLLLLYELYPPPRPPNQPKSKPRPLSPKPTQLLVQRARSTTLLSQTWQLRMTYLPLLHMLYPSIQKFLDHRRIQGNEELPRPRILIQSPHLVSHNHAHSNVLRAYKTCAILMRLFVGQIKSSNQWLIRWV